RELPALGERRLGVCHSRADDLDTSVAPRFTAARRIALPHLADAEARDVGGLSIDSDQLAMIPAEPAEGVRDVRRIEDPNLSSGRDNRGEESEKRGERTGAEPVVDEANLDAAPRAVRQQVHEPPPHRVAMHDVHL